MERDDKYYSLREAEEIRQTYSSWIGKKAYTINGQQEILRNILIEPEHIPGIRLKKNYRVDFEFDNKKICTSHIFLRANGLKPQGKHSPGIENSRNQAG